MRKYDKEGGVCCMTSFMDDPLPTIQHKLYKRPMKSPYLALVYSMNNYVVYSSLFPVVDNLLSSPLQYSGMTYWTRLEMTAQDRAMPDVETELTTMSADNDKTGLNGETTQKDADAVSGRMYSLYIYIYIYIYIYYEFHVS